MKTLTLSERFEERRKANGVENTPHRGYDPLLHVEKCIYRIASLGAVAVSCKHGYDCCPKCDPCTCPV